MAVKIVTQVSAAFSRDVPLDAFLRNPTIEQLARYLHDPDCGRQAPTEALPAGDTPDADYLSVQLLEGEGEACLPKLDAVALAYIPDAFAAASRPRPVRNWSPSGSLAGRASPTATRPLGAKWAWSCCRSSRSISTRTVPA